MRSRYVVFMMVTCNFLKKDNNKKYRYTGWKSLRKDNK